MRTSTSTTRNRLRELRVARGISQTELAANASIGLATLNRIERWHFRVSESTARKVCEALNAEVGEVFPYLAGKEERQ